MLLNMGQNNSLPKPRKRSLRSPFGGKRGSKAILSHTFSLPHDDQKVEQLNINLATEEELMTLPGVTREIAKAIVKHRQAIGRYRKVEDLALVGGIGAEKLDTIRGEVCVKINSCSSSRAQSVDSLKSTDTRVSMRPVDVNKASVFELQCVNGMSQEMAANIVHYRSKKGPFKKLDDLLKVKTINILRYSNMCHYLTIDFEDDRPMIPRTVSASEVLSFNGTGNMIPNGTSTPMKHRKTSSAPVKLHIPNGLPSPSSLGDIFELLSAYTYRPILEEEFRYTRKGLPAFRIATWNLHDFTVEKAMNLGVCEVVCRTILENRWSIVCLQEVLEEEALQFICNELNSPRLRKVKEFRSNSYEWQFTVLDSHLAFIYDAHSGGIGIEMQSVLRQIASDTYKAVLVEFNVGLINIKLLNIELPDKVNVNAIAEDLREISAQHDNIIIVGDLTNLHSSVSIKEIGNLEMVLPLHTNTCHSNIKCNYSDNILVSKGVKNSLTGAWSLVRQGLTHLAIPNGWSWGGPVSPHCPLWAELYVSAPVQNGF